MSLLRGDQNLEYSTNFKMDITYYDIHKKRNASLGEGYRKVEL